MEGSLPLIERNLRQCLREDEFLSLKKLWKPYLPPSSILLKYRW